MFRRKKQPEVTDANQQEYRECFKIKDNVLIFYKKNDAKTREDKDGYIVFINMQNNLDYVDFCKKSDFLNDDLKKFQRCLG